MKTTRHPNLRWLRLKRHLRSCGINPRARRDAERAVLAAIIQATPDRGWLCRGAERRAA